MKPILTGQDFGLQTKFADCLNVLFRLFASGGRGQLDVVHTEIVEHAGDLDFGLSVEVRVGELFTLSKRRLDNLESRNIGKEISHGLIGV